MEKQQLGDYNLIKKIGQGCLGNVYLAEHRFIKKKFAIKLLPEELSNDRHFVQLFEKEISALSQLEHPNIVKVHNVSYAEGYYFIVMDCVVDGQGETTNLYQYLSVHQCKMQESEFLNVLSQIAQALDFAHKKKVGDSFLIHRNIKLNNILVGKVNNKLHLYLSDFGLTSIIGEGRVLSKTFKTLAESLCVDLGKGNKYPPVSDFDKQTKLHQSFIQNYSFLAPEQKKRELNAPLTPRADTYAFGVLAYYLLTRHYPEGVFPMPSTLLPHYQYDWDALVNSCLQMNPNTRPAELTPLLSQVQAAALASSTPSSNVVHKDVSPMSSAHNEDARPYYQDPSQGAATLSPQANLHSNYQHETHENTASATMEKTPVRASAASQQLAEPQPVLNPQEIKRPTYEEDPSAVFQLETTVARYVPQKDEVKEVEPLLTEMVVVPGGEYFRGSNEGARDERPQHQVRISSYALDIHPVTNEQFVRFLEAMGGEKDVNNNDIIRLRESRVKRNSGRLIIESGYSRHPVVGVTWYGATAYAKWIGKRLPFEAEWEIAARSGLSDMTFPTGADIERSEANYFSSDTVNVMSYPPNRFGLYDMAGNVYEWCQDWYDYNFYNVSEQEPDDPKGPLQGVYRVLRGGCWKSLKDDLCTAHRHRNNPGTVNRTYGFRCAADVK